MDGAKFAKIDPRDSPGLRLIRCVSLENLLSLSNKHIVIIPGWPEMVASLLNTNSVPLRITLPMKTAVLPLQERTKDKNFILQTIVQYHSKIEKSY